MKKWFLILVMGLLIAAPQIVSASARLDGLASDIRQVEDIDLIWLYPNKVLQYKNTVDFRLGDTMNQLPNNTNNEWGGVIMDGTGLGTLGFYGNRPNLMPSPWSAIANIPSAWPTVLSSNSMPVGGYNFFSFLGNNLDLFWADSLGGGADLGVHLSYLDSFASFGPSADSQTYGFAVGLGLSGGFFSEFNLHADYSFQNIVGSIGPFGISHDDGIRTFKLGILGQADLEKNLALRSFADFQLESSNYGGLFPNPIGLSDWTLVLGTSLNRSILDGKGLISTGLTLGYNNNHFDDPTVGFFGSFDEVLYQLVWNASAETEVANWLTLRGGVATNLVARFYNSIGFTGLVWGDLSSNRVVGSVGFSVHLQNLSLDAGVRASSLENKIANTEPGGGIFFAPANALVVYTADLKCKF